MMDLSERAAELRDQQSWTEGTLMALALRFISSSGEGKEFDRYLERAAEEENRMYTEEPEESWDGPPVTIRG
jgi:hypothetical protein